MQFRVLAYIFPACRLGKAFPLNIATLHTPCSLYPHCRIAWSEMLLPVRDSLTMGTIFRRSCA